MKPVISIIIPCFNQGNYLEEAIGSIVQVKDKNIYQIIIVNDGSTDAPTLLKLKELTDKGYLVIHQDNKGLGAARNAGIKASSGKYILPLDCDNKIRPEYLPYSIFTLENEQGVDVVYSDGEYFGERTGTFKSREFNLQILMVENYIDACAVFRKSVWEEVGGYDEKMPAMGLEDWDFWLNIAFHGAQFKYIEKVLFDYRYSNKSMVRTMASGSANRVKDYLQKKYSGYLNKSYLNNSVYTNISNLKILAVHIVLKTFLPGVYRLLLHKNILKNKDVI
jgi:glycosyltransferase involved in cell wall biosynthesis